MEARLMVIRVKNEDRMGVAIKGGNGILWW
jgi:hypothetical protein